MDIRLETSSVCVVIVRLWMRALLLTSGTNGGSTIPASSRFQLILLKNWCTLTSRAPYRPFRHPKRTFTVFDSSSWHNDLASSQNLSEYFSGSSYTNTRSANDHGQQQQHQEYMERDSWEMKNGKTWSTWNENKSIVVVQKTKERKNRLTFTRRSTSSRLTFSLRNRNGAWPSIISYKRHPKLNQSGENAYFSLSMTSGAI